MRGLVGDTKALSERAQTDAAVRDQLTQVFICSHAHAHLHFNSYTHNLAHIHTRTTTMTRLQLFVSLLPIHPLHFSATHSSTS